MRLYHGGYCRIINIDLDKCRDYKDFGRGFYLTPDFGRAVNMANRSVILNQCGSAEVTPFIFNKSSCPTHINIKEFKRCNWEWAGFVMNNRDKTMKPPYAHEHDIVIGPVADSSVDAEIAAYRQEFDGEYLHPENLETLAQRLKYHGGYTQYCFCTLRSIEYLLQD